jgi:hypothetical protein
MMVAGIALTVICSVFWVAAAVVTFRNIKNPTDNA